MKLRTFEILNKKQTKKQKQVHLHEGHKFISSNFSSKEAVNLEDPLEAGRKLKVHINGVQKTSKTFSESFYVLLLYVLCFQNMLSFT